MIEVRNMITEFLVGFSIVYLGQLIGANARILDAYCYAIY